MNTIIRDVLFSTALSSGMFWGVRAQNAKHIVIDARTSVAKVAPTMWGVFFEDINFGADGGLYAELIKNRSFEFNDPWMGWKKLGKAVREGTYLIENRMSDNPDNPRYMRISAGKTAKGDLGLSNEGFRGMGIKAGAGYDFSVLYRTIDPGRSITLEIKDSSGNIIGQCSLVPAQADGQWHKQQVSFAASRTVMNAHVEIWLTGEGNMDIDMVSLFPQDTWKRRPGGLRADMVQRLADLRPGFIRFPGGCIVEGRDLSNRYQWKKTIGPVEDRKQIVNRWNMEFAHRPAPDYYQSFGLGFFEYFQLSEDIGAEPLPILNCGMACQFNTAEVEDLNALDPYVQDALDLIEFANGDANSAWGRKRAAMGHPAPFNLKILGIGNENWGPQYIERLHHFQKAITARYPGIKLVCSSGTDSEGERFNFLDDTLRKMQVGFVDEHYYRTPGWFLENADRYDNYPRNGSKVFAGEYAAQSDAIGSVKNRNTWQTAISEAAFMTGLERNAGVVQMASYAPLFAHVDAWQWTPDLIWVNNLHTYVTPDYYVQQLFSVNKGTDVIAATYDGMPLEGKDQLFISAVKDENKKEIILKVVNAAVSVQKLNFEIMVKNKCKDARLVTLYAQDPTAQNGFDHPGTVAPTEASIIVKGNHLSLDAAANTFYVIKLNY